METWLTGLLLRERFTLRSPGTNDIQSTYMITVVQFVSSYETSFYMYEIAVRRIYVFL